MRQGYYFLIFYNFVQMSNGDTKEKLKNIVCRTGIEGTGDSCTTIRNHLCRSFKASPTIKRAFEDRAIVKEKQAEYLREYCKRNDLWLTALPKDANYLTHGGEAKVYLNGDCKSALKLNDSVYYATWLILIEGSNFKSKNHNSYLDGIKMEPLMLR